MFKLLQLQIPPFFPTRRRRALIKIDLLTRPQIAWEFGKTGRRKSQASEALPASALALKLHQAKLSVSATQFIAFSILAGITLAILLGKLLSPFILPLAFLAGFFLPLSWLDSRIDARAAEFSEDYPTVLLATASSMKTGMTPYQALERSVQLLAPSSLVRSEVEGLLSNLRAGMSSEEAVRRFASSVRQPDLELFRSAFMLVLENGGRFAPTLERLAQVTKERVTLIQHARVSTASMRMTANVLLAVAPFLLFILSGRTQDFWELLLHHPVANPVATLGFSLIGTSYIALRKMSNFRP